jgi:gliding motility-associated-like protein
MNFTWDPDPAIVTNEVQFNDATSYNGNIPTSWSWTLEGIEFADIPDPTFSFPEPGVYEICMFSETQFDCSELHCELVEVIPAELVLPNVVSPNNDGINDYLIIQYIDQFDSSQLFVFNRWGNVVYEASNYKNDWSPKELSDGVYYYVVDIDGVKSYSSALQVKR